ncbi:hypothetical protein [Streptomyces inhibens]|uniref:hypothetical protein n=1 Tax=Streptomyces inhibens TaxID=2293571 RepID=UPI001EE75851|nr:hypothetical protein [Streptomyces inhibens]UKY48810.1 hypothetical protein KI385_08395 [Streptomyces inhibens]
MRTPIKPSTGISGRTRTRRAATALATAGLTVASLIGTHSPAFAADGVWYDNDAQVDAMLARTAPLNSSEAIMGYPVSGLETKLTPLAEVESKYPHQKALEDVQTQLGSVFNLDPDVAVKDSPDIRTSSQDDIEPWIPRGPFDNGMTAKEECRRQGISPVPGVAVEPACGFVGVLEKSYPSNGATARVAGGSKLTFKQQATVSKTESDTTGWSVGGKVNAKIGKTDTGEIGVEGSFEYSQSTTTTNGFTSMRDETVETTVPGGHFGWIDERVNGGWYIGYIVYKITLMNGADDAPKQKLVAIPARVLIQSPTTLSPVTWAQRKVTA